MNESKALKLIDIYFSGEFNPIEIITEYCLHKGKDGELTAKLIATLTISPEYIISLIPIVIESILEEFNIILLHDKHGNYITSYINKTKQNGKEIQQI